MFKGRKTLVRATLTMIGTIIGAGIFGVPAMFERTGFLVGSVVFWAIALAVLAAHLLFVELIERDPERRRFPGYVGKALGSWAKALGAVMYALELTGANFAYVVLGGLFLLQLVAPFGLAVSTLVWQVLFWIAGVLIVLSALRVVAKIESFLTWLLIAVMVAVIAFAASTADPTRFAPQQWSAAFAPFGIFVFALFGIMAIPEIHEIVNRRKDRTRIAVAVGTLVSALLTWLFGVAVFAGMPIAASSQASDPTVLALILPFTFRWLLPLVGLLAVITSFIVTAFDLQAMLRLDLKQSVLFARIFAFGAPLLLLFLATRDFLNIVDVVGALFTAANGVLACVAAAVVMRHGRVRSSVWWRIVAPAAASAVFIIAIVQRLIAFTLN
jgi:amino acid permease